MSMSHSSSKTSLSPEDAEAGKQHQFSLGEAVSVQFLHTEKRELRPLLLSDSPRSFLLSHGRHFMTSVKCGWTRKAMLMDSGNADGSALFTTWTSFPPSLTGKHRCLLSATLRLPPFGSPQLLATTPDLPAASGGTTVRFTTL